MFNNTFQRITGFSPYPYQEKIANAVAAGNSVLLIAPTGSGKTWAAVAPFIHAKMDKDEHPSGFADRLIYALPLRTLASSLHDDVVKAAKLAYGEESIVTTGKDRDYRRRDQLFITIQTGENQEDPFFSGDIVFTTIDQLLSAYINLPLSLPKRLSNINAGALIGAQIVLDEFHLLEEGKSLSTAVEMIDRLRKFTNVIIMTATLSEPGCEKIATILRADRIELQDKERLMLPAESKRVRSWCFNSVPLDATSVLSTHKQRSIVLCNTVNRAQELYQAIKEASPKGTTTILLHSRYYPDDRSAIETEVIKRFGKAAQNKNDSIILVTTQVIEAGMDISCNTMHSEIAPVNALVQRAGRCVRYGGEGLVTIYELVDPSITAPYNRDLVNATRVVLPGERTAIDFSAERALIDAVHGAREGGFFDGFSINSHRKQVASALSGTDMGAVRVLIRDIDSVQLIITDNPERIEFSRNAWPMALSTPRSTAIKALKDKLTHVWIAEMDDSEDTWSGIAWHRANNISNISSAWLISINPDIGSYSSELGLRIGESGEMLGVKYLKRPPIPFYSYKMETFAEHAQRSAAVFNRISSGYEQGLDMLAKDLSKNPNDLYRLIEKLVLLHDIGKLSRDWQSFASAWQSIKNPSDVVDKPLAHTDYDPICDRQLLKRVPNRPPHAAEGAFALGGWLFRDEFIGQGIAKAVMTAVARHHSGHTSSVREFDFIEGFQQVIDCVVDENKHGESISSFLIVPKDILECKQFSDYLLNPSSKDDEPFIPLYWYLARLIRLSDQLATKEVNENEVIC